MGATPCGNHQQLCSTPTQSPGRELAGNLAASDLLLRISGSRSCALQTGTHNKMAAQFDARLANTAVALPFVPVARGSTRRNERTAGAGCAGCIFRVLLGRLLYVAKIRARAGRRLLLFACPVAALAEFDWNVRGRSGLYCAFLPGISNHLLSVNRRCDVIIYCDSVADDRLNEQVDAGLRGFVNCNTWLSANIRHGSVRHKKGRKCFASSRRENRT